MTPTTQDTRALDPGRRHARWTVPLLAVALLAPSLLGPESAHACGGFFCGRQPVDQSAERILFAINTDGTTTMITQISYKGEAADFAWIVPIGQVPLGGSLGTFSQLALTSLDANTGVRFDTSQCFGRLNFGADAGVAAANDGGDVTVHLRAEVGPYDVAVVSSPDPSELTTWLRTDGFRVTDAMAPYIDLYTTEGMKFLALRLLKEAGVEDIVPFAMTLPGTVPSIPLRMTALAAEPEMGIVVLILGDQRYKPSNWPELEVDLTKVAANPFGGTNWTKVVAETVDDAGGQGFVTEMAGPTAPILERLLAVPPLTPEQEAAQLALSELLSAHPYLTRLYTRLSAEEMTSDPIFGRSSGGDVDAFRVLPGGPYCDPIFGIDWNPCMDTACGAGGLCRLVDTSAGPIAGCACVPGATARTTFDPTGSVTVACQDRRMSFLNPGDRELPTLQALPDPCVGFDCGAGQCVAVNMTPTCVCDEGQVAVGSLAADGSRQTTCTTPTQAVPSRFYNQRLPDRPADLPAGLIVDVPPPSGVCSLSPGRPGRGEVGWAVAAMLGLAWLGRRRRG